jgi:hypothetical protein
LWREDEATVDAQITLPQARDATLYLPTTGREPVGTLSGMSAFTVTVGPDPVLVQLR